MQAAIIAALSIILPEIKAGQGIGLAEAARLIPPYRLGRRTHAATLTRWIQYGVRSPNGGRTKLEAVRCGSRWITTPGAIERFLVAQQSPPSEDHQPDRTPARRNRAAEAAVAELERMGA